MEKRKRKEGHITAWLGLIGTLLWMSFALICCYYNGFSWSAFLLWWIPELIPLSMIMCCFKTTQHEKTLEFIILEYEVWVSKKQVYEKRYIYDRKTLRSKFILHFYKGDYVDVNTEEQMKQSIMNMNTEYQTWTGYETKEDAMKDIIKEIRQFIKTDKEIEKVIFRNITTLESLSVDSLKVRVEAGEFVENESTSN